MASAHGPLKLAAVPTPFEEDAAPLPASVVVAD